MAAQDASLDQEDPGFDGADRALAEKDPRLDKKVSTVDQRDERLAGGDRKFAARPRCSLMPRSEACIGAMER